MILFENAPFCMYAAAKFCFSLDACRVFWAYYSKRIPFELVPCKGQSLGNWWKFWLLSVISLLSIIDFHFFKFQLGSCVLHKKIKVIQIIFPSLHAWNQMQKLRELKICSWLIGNSHCRHWLYQLLVRLSYLLNGAKYFQRQ